jgi:FecR protein
MLSKASSRFFLPVLVSLLTLPALSDSAVRIVRLSYVQNDVHIDRGTGQYEKAMLNLPITAGARLETGRESLAEVEFEDVSTIRLAPDTHVEISRLSLRDSGEKVSTAEIVEGTAYVNFAGRKDNQLTVQFGAHSIVLSRPSRLRIRIGPEEATVAVFKGDIQITGPSGAQKLKKKETAKLEFSDEGAMTLVKAIEREPYDHWEKKQDQYHSRFDGNTGHGRSAYGLADLSYYGNFFSAPGYGMLWQPYFADVGWDPFMAGAWVFYPGAGFTWVSSYPWGWTPFHCGRWVFLAGYGWAWQPGGVWSNWYSQPTLVNAPPAFFTPHPPRTGTTTLVVNRLPVGLSKATPPSPGTLALRSNSAGLGVPRGQIRNLASVSRKIENRAGPARTFNSPAMASGAPAGGYGRGSARPAPASGPAMHSSTAAPVHSSAPAAPAHASTSAGGRR